MIILSTSDTVYYLDLSGHIIKTTEDKYGSQYNELCCMTEFVSESGDVYTLENEYDYTLDQNNGVLILRDGEEEITFQANFAN